MTSIETMIAFFAWCSIINIGMLLFSAIFIVIFKDMAIKIHTKMFDVDKVYLQQAYFKYLAQYKIVIIIFNIVPYFALKIIV